MAIVFCCLFHFAKKEARPSRPAYNDTIIPCVRGFKIGNETYYLVLSPLSPMKRRICYNIISMLQKNDTVSYQIIR